MPADTAALAPDPPAAAGQQRAPDGRHDGGDGPVVDTYRPRHALDLRLTLSPLRRGRGDPTWADGPDGAVWRAHRTPLGPATTRLHQRRGEVDVAAWGPGAAWAVEAVPELLGSRDDGVLDASLHPVVAAAHHRHPGLRVPRSADVLGALVPGVLEQRVVGLDAKASWRRLVARHGEAAPGPVRLVVPPPAPVWRDLPDWEWRRAGVEGARSDTVRRAAAVASRLEETVAMPVVEARRRLTSVRGIGAWTCAEVTSRAHGDADAVPVGDYHLPSIVGWALTGEPADDARMLELLEPWRGQRHRVVRLVALTATPPRRAPRSPRAVPLR